MRRRVGITGIGVVCALGSRLDEFWAACLAGRSVVATIPSRWHDYADYHSTLWSPLPGPDSLLEGFTRVERNQHDPVALIAADAAGAALGMAGFLPELDDRRARTHYIPGIEPDRAMVCMGTGIGGAHSFLANHAHQILARPAASLARLRGAGGALDPAIESTLERLPHPARFNPFVVSMLMPNASAAFLGIRYGLRGPNLSLGLACAAGTAAIGHAYRAVSEGRAELALAGGTEYLDDHYGGIFAGFDTARALVRDCADPDRANRPYDRSRSGFLFSQGGAAVLMLEPIEAVLRRGGTVIAEVAGYAESFDAHSMMALAPGGAQIERMVRLALDDAGLAVGDIDYVNGHGTGTGSNDEVETEVLSRVFGSRVRVNSTKSLLGHTIGASGALEAAVVALSLRDGRTHPCRNLEDPIADLAFVREADPFHPRAAMSLSFAFGGHNAALVLRRAG